ncbi:MAG: glycerophosphodiester phosphodiesterase [Ekhidna sp.]|nr:glycerophosphodiester phosphodiesterase [Ekhidna sp.]
MKNILRKNWLILCFLVGCTYQHDEKSIAVEVQGHRGARGLAPENSLPAFVKALEFGVKTLELDLAVSKDSQLVVSHEPYFSHVFCLDSVGNEIPEDSVINLYELNYADIKKCDCGSKVNPTYPSQTPVSTHKPTLQEVFDSISVLDTLDLISYNIELKTKKETDSVFHPIPEVFSELVYQLLKDNAMLSRITIQSFDFRTLQYFNGTYPEVPLVLLIENDLSWKTNVDSLGFVPEVYSPYYRLLSQKIIGEIRSAGMKVIPWTVNEVTDMEQLIEWGVDGIITDYPDRAQIATKSNE